MDPSIFFTANLHSTEPFWLHKGPSKHKATNILLPVFLSYNQSRMHCPWHCSFPKVFLHAPKKSPLKARVGKNTKIRKTTGDAIPAQACADFMWALGAGPLAHRLAAGEEQSPSLAYKYICELCDSVGTPSSSSLLDGLCLQRSLRCGFCKCHLLHLCCFLPSCRVWFLLCSIHLLLPLNATFLSSPFSFS